MDEDVSDDFDLVEVDDGKTEGIDDALIRWCAQLKVQGMKDVDIRRKLVEAGMINTSLAPSHWKRLMRLSKQEAEEMRWLTVAKAELDDTDWLRLDSYARRRRTLAKMEAVVTSAHAQADTVSKLNQVSFMLGGLTKMQDSMDAMTGAKDAKPAVVVNIGYDPLEQMRTVIQDASFEVVEEEEDEGVSDE